MSHDDDRGLPEVAPWLLGIVGAWAGFMLTAGWTARVAWGVVHDRCGQAH